MNKTADIADVQSHLREWVAEVASGGEIIICQNDAPVAKIVPVLPSLRNPSLPGREKGRTQILGDLNEPLIPAEDWNMLRPDFDPLR